jgi:hypothetical protein
MRKGEVDMRLVLEVEDGCVITISGPAHGGGHTVSMAPPEQMALNGPGDMRGKEARAQALAVIDRAFPADERDKRFQELRREEIWGGVPSLTTVAVDFSNWRGNTAPQNYNANALFKLYLEAKARLG